MKLAGSITVPSGFVHITQHSNLKSLMSCVTQRRDPQQAPFAELVPLQFACMRMDKVRTRMSSRASSRKHAGTVLPMCELLIVTHDTACITYSAILQVQVLSTAAGIASQRENFITRDKGLQESHCM